MVHNVIDWARSQLLRTCMDTRGTTLWLRCLWGLAGLSDESARCGGRNRPGAPDDSVHRSSSDKKE